jgi:predicted P-loop ATPase/GTPase
MTTYQAAAQALVAAGFLDKAGLDAATAILANKLIAADVRYSAQMAAAQADEVRQEEVMADATAAIVESDKIRDFEDEALERKVIAAAAAQKQMHEAIVEPAQQARAQAYREAAEALERTGFVVVEAIDDVAAVIAMVLDKTDRLYNENAEI